MYPQSEIPESERIPVFDEEKTKDNAAEKEFDLEEKRRIIRARIKQERDRFVADITCLERKYLNGNEMRRLGKRDR